MIMASFARRRTPAAAWSVDDASTFAAQKEFKLLQLLSTDKKAFATARRLGLYSTQPQLQQTARSSAAATATSARRRPDAASGRLVGPNSRQKRSAERSARHHAQLQVQFYRTAIAVLYICRLRRMCRQHCHNSERSAEHDTSGVQESTHRHAACSSTLLLESASVKGSRTTGEHN